jgi:hypothetical protein
MTEAVGINLAASAAFYMVTTDRKHWQAAIAAGVLGLWLWRTGAAVQP